jgi:hypothetical protein
MLPREPRRATIPTRSGESLSVLTSRLPFKAAYLFQPSGIQLRHGVGSKIPWLSVVYAVATAAAVQDGASDVEPYDNQFVNHITYPTGD